jgi:hypothetical protein
MRHLTLTILGTLVAVPAAVLLTGALLGFAAALLIAVTHPAAADCPRPVIVHTFPH